MFVEVQCFQCLPLKLCMGLDWLIGSSSLHFAQTSFQEVQSSDTLFLACARAGGTRKPILQSLTVGDLPFSLLDLGVPLYQARCNLHEVKDLEV